MFHITDSVWHCVSDQAQFDTVSQIKPEEVKKLVEGFKKADGLREHGITVGGVKYFYLQSDDTQIQGKKGSTGLCMAKAGKCIVIGIYGEGQQPGNCRMQVERIRDYLVGAGY